MENYSIRLINKTDFKKGYLKLISQLTNEEINCNEDFFINHLKLINNSIYVIEFDNIIIASVTLIIEKKFIHNFKSVCHIEDVIVHKDYQKKGLGSLLINFCIEFAKKNNCYKTILNCSEKLEKFYSKFNLKKKNIQMSIYYY